MKDREEFIKTLVDIDYVESSGGYGHYPFQLFVETANGNIEMNALALGGDVLACYGRVRKYVQANAKKIFLSLDFPAGGDILNDFVAVFTIIDGQVESLAIPYNPTDGKKYAHITTSAFLTTVQKQFESIVLKP